MASRSAEATIKGYYYQFDATILKLLQLQCSTDYIVVEGIEDIDINTAKETETVQCKYLSKPNFIISAVREPIMLMLDHFINFTHKNIKYTLYVHFVNETPGQGPEIDLLKLKDILTYKEDKITKCYFVDKGISDKQLKNFLNQFKLVFGAEFEQQQKETLHQLKRQFKCTDFEADSFFYNNALRVIIDKARLSDEQNRKISRAEFIKCIDSSGKLFNEWYIKLRTKKEYLLSVKTVLKTTKALEPSRSKCIILGNEILNADNDALPLIAFIENLVNKYYKVGVSLRNAVPPTLVLDMENEYVLDLKKDLLDREIDFNDGQEHIKFTSKYFNKEPIFILNKPVIKILHSSYVIKMVSLSSFVSHFDQVSNTKVVLHFAKAKCPYVRSKHYQWFDIKYCDNLNDVSLLIL